MLLLLPKGSPVYEGLATGTYDPPAMLEKLQLGGLTGYGRFTFPAAAAVFLFHGGKLRDAVLERSGRRVSGLDALTRTFELLASEGGQLDVYSLSPDLASCLHGLLRGEALYEGQELSILNIQGLLAKIKAMGLTGCLRVYTDERTALIFYKNGEPLGFFHDGSEEMETAAEESQRIARLPGARLDAFMLDGFETMDGRDLLALVDLEKAWQLANRHHTEGLAQLAEERRQRRQRRRDAALAELQAALQGIARKALGPVGTQVVDKAVSAGGGPGALLTKSGAEAFLGEVEKAAKLLIGASHTRRLAGDLSTELERHTQALELAAH